jgi:MFS family permease
MLEKIGVRKTMMRVLICWGVVSVCMRFISSQIEFYVMRFMLGVFEAGFVPGAILYLTYWYPETRRARVLGIFSSAITIAGVIGSPVFRRHHDASGRRLRHGGLAMAFCA